MSYKEEYERLLLEKGEQRKKKNKTISKLKQMLFDEEIKNSNLVKSLKSVLKDSERFEMDLEIIKKAEDILKCSV